MPFTITPDPADGPQLYYTDGVTAVRLDQDERALVGASHRELQLVKAMLNCADQAVQVANREAAATEHRALTGGSDS